MVEWKTFAFVIQTKSRKGLCLITVKNAHCVNWRRLFGFIYFEQNVRKGRQRCLNYYKYKVSVLKLERRIVWIERRWTKSWKLEKHKSSKSKSHELRSKRRVDWKRKRNIKSNAGSRHKSGCRRLKNVSTEVFNWRVWKGIAMTSVAGTGRRAESHSVRFGRDRAGQCGEMQLSFEQRD